MSVAKGREIPKDRNESIGQRIFFSVGQLVEARSNSLPFKRVCSLPLLAAGSATFPPTLPTRYQRPPFVDAEFLLERLRSRKIVTYM